MSPRHNPDRCLATREVLNRVGDKWSVLIVGMLGGGPRRINDLRRSIDGTTDDGYRRQALRTADATSKNLGAATTMAPNGKPTHCKTVILDTQNVRGAPVDLLKRLAERGFQLHVSTISFEELWAQAVRQDKLGLLVGRVRAIAQHIEPREPIKTAGVSLVRRLGGTVRGALIPAEAGDSEKLRDLWRAIADNRISDNTIRKAGRQIEEDALLRADSWFTTNQAAAAVEEWSGTEHSEDEIVRKVSHRFFEMFGRDLSIHRVMHERFNGYYRAAALHAARSKERVTGKHGKLNENDAEDLQLLMHLAEGAFLGTFDLNLIEHVDASASFQAPWVRTLGELLSADLPVGLPWGKSARRIARAHRARERGELNRLEHAARTPTR
jgi:hypothetical protein